MVGAVVITHRVARAALVSADGRLSGRVEEPYDWLQCPDIVAEVARLLATAREKGAGSASLDHVVLGLPFPTSKAPASHGSRRSPRVPRTLRRCRRGCSGTSRRT